MILHLLVSIFVLTSINSLESYVQQTEGNKWIDYYQKTINSSRPEYTLFLALQYFEEEGRLPGLAVDLGAGTGRDSLFLLEKEWFVFAVDAQEAGLEILCRRANGYAGQFAVQIAKFTDMVLPYNIDLINASYSLPFCHPSEFSDCWQNMIDHLTVGGRFSGQLFGDRDEWSSNPNLTFHTQKQVLELFKSHFDIEYFEIEEGSFPTAAGAMKHWHIFHVVAKKIR